LPVTPGFRFWGDPAGPHFQFNNLGLSLIKWLNRLAVNAKFFLGPSLNAIAASFALEILENKDILFQAR